MKPDEYAESVVAQHLPDVYEAHKTANDLELAERMASRLRLNHTPTEHVELVDRLLHVVRPKRKDFPKAAA